jgi:hypothetical protein
LIYCVVPPAMTEQLYDQLVAYYADDENVTVIVDRRQGERRDRHGAGEHPERRQRDRRQRPIADREPRVSNA